LWGVSLSAAGPDAYRTPGLKTEEFSHDTHH
jgi:hypothetical protein